MKHRDRKNPHMAEKYADLRRELNLLRPKQKFDEKTKTWSR